MSRGATPGARWFHELQPISNDPAGLGFPHGARRHRPGGRGNIVFVAGLELYRCGRIDEPGIEPYISRVAQVIYTSPSHSAISHVGRYRPWVSPLSPRVVGFVYLRTNFCTGDIT